MSQFNNRPQDFNVALAGLSKRSRLTTTLFQIAAEKSHHLYLVGGFIRDLFMGRVGKDIDFVTPRASELAASLAENTGCHTVLFDRKFGTIRLIPVTAPEGEFDRIDLAPLRGSSIEEDLSLRDFTINALALDISAWQGGVIAFIDPLGGLRDLSAGRLRACTHQSLTDDPLRILRAYRLVSTYGLALEPKTREWIVEGRRGLDEVAVERIRDELVLILSASNSAAILRMLDADHLLELVLPEYEPMRDLRQNDFHHQDVWQHSLSALEALETFLSRPQELLGNHTDEALAVLNQKIAGDRTRQSLLKLAVLLHDIGKPACRTVDKDGFIHFYDHERVGARLAGAVCSRLCFSNKEIHFVSQLVRQHMRAIHLFNLGRPSRRALARFFGLGPSLFWPLLLLFASDYRATRGPRSLGGDMRPLQQRMGEWLEFYHHQLKPREVKPPLVSGHDLMDYLHLAPGPTVGKLLQALAELQWEGRITTRQEALHQAAQLLKEWGSGGKE
ncbi:MAG: HD domain-containing protein [Deltaproteobacteria bacterium]|nr:MAG: HD domain-containing protein [Deltaproteobacteria bacterium]